MVLLDSLPAVEEVPEAQLVVVPGPTSSLDRMTLELPELGEEPPLAAGPSSVLATVSTAGSPAALCPSPAAPAVTAPLLNSVVVGNGNLVSKEETVVGDCSLPGVEEVPVEVAPESMPLLDPVAAGPVVEDDAVGWQVVCNKRRPSPLLPPRSPPQRGEDRAMAFRRKLRGKCFRCFSPDHRVADCHGKVRCLGCRRSGHRERDCWQHQKPSQADLCPGSAAGSPAAGSRRPLDRSWASVAAPTSRVQPITNPGSASLVAALDATSLRDELRGLIEPQLREMTTSQSKMEESVQGLLTRLRSLLERAEEALERLSLPSAVVQVEPTPPLCTGGNAECADGEIVPFGCYSPRGVSSSASPLALESTSTPSAASEHVSPVVQGPPMQDLRVERLLALEELRGSDAPSPEEKIAKVMAQFDVIEPQEQTLSCSMVELCREIADMPKDKQLRVDVPSLAERRSIRLDKKNKDCGIPAAKRAEFRRAEAFGEIPKLKSKEKVTDEVIEEKMQFYLQMYKKQRTPQVMEAFRELVVSNV